MNYKIILTIVGVLVLGTLGALIFDVFLLPYFLLNPYFERFEFVKEFKAGKIIVNPTNQVYIQENDSVQNAILSVKNSVVAIEWQSPSGIVLRGGLVATSDGSIVTLLNAIPANGIFSVFLQGKEVNYKIIKTDPKNNLALLKIDQNNLATVGFATQNKMQLGEEVFLVSSVSDKQDNWLVDEGIIREIDLNSVKTNISEKAVVSGSGLFNSFGQLLGLNFVDSDGKISAIPIDKIQALLGL